MKTVTTHLSASPDFTTFWVGYTDLRHKHCYTVAEISLTFGGYNSGKLLQATLNNLNAQLKSRGYTIESSYGWKELQIANRDKWERFVNDLTEHFANFLLEEKIPLDIMRADTGEILIAANRKITKALLRKVAVNYDKYEIYPSPILNRVRETCNYVMNHHGITNETQWIF